MKSNVDASGDCNICINSNMPSYSAICVECGLSRKNFKPITKLVPEPHGRLIDADEALKKIKPIVPEDQQNACTIETTKRLMMNLINNAPTVIPASK